jgi:di/tricarboxylate transporter
MWLVVAIVAISTVLFFTEWLSVDLVALLVLGSLALTGLVDPGEALAGFSNSAVVTVWAVFVLSGGLTRTGVANRVGHAVLRLAGHGEARLMALIMVTAAVLSGFMNNVGVAALLLPVVMDIARRTERPPSRLLLPLAFACLIGGSMTLIGTPPNLLVSEALRDAGREGFRLFDFFPIGLALTVAGILYMILLGRRLLPDKPPGALTGMDVDLAHFYGLEERLFEVEVPSTSPLVGQTLAQTRLGAALEVNVLGIRRAGRMIMAPSPDTVIQVQDRLIVAGRRRYLRDLLEPDYLTRTEDAIVAGAVAGLAEQLAVVRIVPGSSLVGKSVPEADFRRAYGLNVLSVWREGRPVDAELVDVALQAEDVLVVQGPPEQMAGLTADAELRATPLDADALYRLEEHLFVMRVPDGSPLTGQTLAGSRLGDAFGLTVIAVMRQGETLANVGPSFRLEAGDRLLIEGEERGVVSMAAIQTLRLIPTAALTLSDVETEAVGLMEVTLSPHSRLAGSTLRGLHFRSKYDLSVLAIWRAGEVLLDDLPDIPLRFGDALLMYGRWDRLELLGSEPDFLVLTEAAQEPVRAERAPVAVLIMLAVVLAVLVGIAPIQIAAVIGAAFMVIAGCLTMDEAYHFIEWKAVFLIAGMVPLGTAMQASGLAQFVAERVVGLVGGAGDLPVIAGVFLLTVVGSQIMPNAVMALLIAPIALNTATSLGISPYSMMITVAVGATASFLTPVGHPANVLVMGPGGYRFSDYVRVGLPLVFVVLAVLLLVLPVVWPL